MVDDEEQTLCHEESPTMEGVLDTLEEFHEATGPQGRSLAHGFIERVVETEYCTKVVADAETQ